MKNEIILVDLFSGIGGFAYGLKAAGYTITHHYFSEIDKHAIANYKYNFKNAQYIGSVTDVCGNDIRKKHPNAKIVITFGSPCQISHWLEKEKGWKEKEVALSWKQLGLLLKFNQIFISGKMLREHSPVTMAQTFGQFSTPLPTLGTIDLNGNCLIQVGFYPKIESEFTLSDILQEKVNPEYFLSQKMTDYLTKRSNQTKDGHKPNLVHV